MRKLLLILFCIPLFAQVPNTNTFTMQDVCDEIGVSYSGRTLTELFNLANDSGFDPAYVGSKNSLLNFRNYNHISGLRYEGINLVAPDARGIYVSNFGNWASYAIDGAIKTLSLSTNFNISTASNTYTFNTSQANSARGVTFSYSGVHMYITRNDRWVWHSEMTQSAFRPDLGVVFVDEEDMTAENFFISSSGDMMIKSDVFDSTKYIESWTLGTPYNVSTRQTLGSTKSNMPSIIYGVYGTYHYFAKVVGQEVEIYQYISDSQYDVDGISPASPESVKTIQNLPPITSVQAIYPSSNGLYLYLNALGTDGIRRIWQITMTGTNIL